ncbi:phosphatidylinositol-3,5-bisphosphate 5-phosphatase [Coemansia biformis]|uniref:Phosphatidylinositol-3,5-bisphosphate 5-phosphatase n=1 Tax=Coemansia biformis TaxID=1286918 RepID=A0A9W8CYY2_9FUNG|nr:phosphatidylinositol-3,5-bisphosphate 5-phosphatase [Coemansia biformis]
MSSGDEHALQRPTAMLNLFEIYESKSQLCIVGSNESEGYYRVLRINRTASDIGQMATDDGITHSRESIQQLVARMLASGMRLVVSGVLGIVGFVRFTKGYYISLVTGRKPVALLGGHHVYHIEDIRLFSIAYRPERSDAEERCIARFRNVDLTKNFYYSHTYDITHTLQRNVAMCQPAAAGRVGRQKWEYNSMFVWNYQLICNATQGFGVGAEWAIALIHGYVDQSRLSIFGRDVYITLIARRSRVFAGVRYLKRGVNDAGYVANDVETEQIVSTMELTSFDMPYGRPFSSPNYTSYVQHRGSIPLFWSQETSGIAPKPPIEINVRDPYFVEAGRHFDSLFRRYGTPVVVLNLIKTKERAKRESVLGEEFSEGIHYLNQFLPRGKKIRYLAWDMSRAKKNRQEDVLAILEVIAEETLALTGYFHNGSELYSNYLKRRAAGDRASQRKGIRRQTGIVRSNCIDCLDRTNAAQSIISKVALAHQLFELGQIDEPVLSFNTDAAMIIEEMYHDLGNTIALQYGGSHLVNTVQTYRRSTNWRSHSRDIVESLRRYYSNSLLDMERQEAITYFLEKSIFPECNPAASRAGHPLDGDGVGVVVSRPNQVGKPVFRKWWTTLGDSDDEFAGSSTNGREYDDDDGDGVGSSSSSSSSNDAGGGGDGIGGRGDLRYDADDADPTRADAPGGDGSNNNSGGRSNGGSDSGSDDGTSAAIRPQAPAKATAEQARDGYWNEYYRPHTYTSFDELFVSSLNTSASLHPTANVQDIPSPFADRGSQGRKAVSRARYAQREPKWLRSEAKRHADPTRASRREIYERVCAKTITQQPLQPLGIGGWFTDGISAPLQEPSVSQAEVDEYEKYVHQFDDLKKWVVPPSTLLYSDYLRARDGGLPLSGGTDPGRYRLGVPSGLSIDTSAAPIYAHGDGWQSRRSQTPVPGASVRARQAPHSAQPAHGRHLRRLLGPHHTLSPTLSPTTGRQRSSTSGERGALWGLWSQHQQQQQGRHQSKQSPAPAEQGEQPLPSRPASRFGLARAAASSLLPLSAGLPRMALGTLGRRARHAHDRSRSLDLTGADALKMPAALGPSGAGLGGAAVGAEPRVAEADLAMYQQYATRLRRAAHAPATGRVRPSRLPVLSTMRLLPNFRAIFASFRTDDEERSFRNAAILRLAGFVAACAAMSIIATQYKVRPVCD